MFISDTHRRQILPAEAYCSQTQFDREIELLFKRGWFLVGTLAEIPREGDFLTQDILGHPVIVWRSAGTTHAFLNVCAHRSCLLTSAPSGTMPRLRCQYHGWEYDETGNTRKIPDAKSFRPLRPGLVGLRKFRSQVVGEVIFVALSEEAPPLQEWLGPAYQMVEEVCAGPWQFHGVGDRELDADWKTYIENTIETYHVEAVHPHTLFTMPEEASCRHEVNDRWSLLKTRGKPGHLDIMDAVAHRVLGAARDPDYHNLVVYPSLAIGKMSLFSWIDQALPVAPGRMRVVARGFSNTGRHGWWRSGLMAYLVRRWGRRFMKRIVEEDVKVLRDVQRGLRSPLQPLGGLISIREERIFHFQKFIERATGLEVAPPAPLPNPGEKTPEPEPTAPVGGPPGCPVDDGLVGLGPRGD